MFENDPSVLEYPVLDKERGKTAEELMIEVLEPILNYIKRILIKTGLSLKKV